MLVTGAAGNGGQAVCRALAQKGHRLRMADVAPPPPDVLALGEFVRCDTRTADDARRAVEGAQAVVHLAAWHCAHQPPVSDATIFAVNVDGTFNVLEACRAAGVRSLVFASSMAYGWGSVYSVTKVIGEELCRSFHETTGASVTLLRYHAFVPDFYLEYGARLLRNGVDRRDVATATLAALEAVAQRRVKLFRTIVHTQHGMPAEVVGNFRELGPDWCEQQVPGARQLLEKYRIELPQKVEQHDLSEAQRVLGWTPAIGFLEFLRDLQRRDARGEDVTQLHVPGGLLDWSTDGENKGAKVL
ncbi:MAG: UDP-glucose 4-epimerase [Abditibacteriota bacterium]|nr:UDP-glucose 4-epimerase [Abditibacteriota bacterium]